MVIKRKVIVKKNPDPPKKLGIEFSGEDQEFLIQNYWIPYKDHLTNYYLNEDDWLTKCEFPVKKNGEFDKRTTNADMVEYTFPGKEHLQKYTWGRKKIKRKR